MRLVAREGGTYARDAIPRRQGWVINTCALSQCHTRLLKERFPDISDGLTLGIGEDQRQHLVWVGVEEGFDLSQVVDN